MEYLLRPLEIGKELDEALILGNVSCDCGCGDGSTGGGEADDFKL